MQHFSFKILFGILLISFTANIAQAQQARMLDKIVAVVNDHIILQSDVDARTTEFIRNSRGMEFTQDLWFDVLESVIDNYVLYEQAKIDSIVVTDDEVNRAMDNRIRQLVTQVGSEQALEEALGQSIIQIRAQYRSNFREEMMVERVRDKKMRSIRITRSEVEEFFNRIPQDSLPLVPETVELSHIVVIPPVRQEARRAAFEKATMLRDSLINHGANFEELARRHSDGPGAANGGFLPLLPLSDLVSEYSAAAAALQPGQISEVVETRFGFHVIRLNRRVGDQIETNHILIQVREEEVDEDFAREKLMAIRDSVLTHNRDFRELARRHSDDKSTAPTGGRLSNPRTGDRRLVVSDLDPDLYRASLSLEEVGQISEPIRFTTGPQNNRQVAFRIIRLNNRVEEHHANMQQDYDIIMSYALQEKRFEQFTRWMKELRDEVYVEYRVSTPHASQP
jgi:peptidyl-prolyl cis-trans isomerase SurA